MNPATRPIPAARQETNTIRNCAGGATAPSASRLLPTHSAATAPFRSPFVDDDPGCAPDISRPSSPVILAQFSLCQFRWVVFADLRVEFLFVCMARLSAPTSDGPALRSSDLWCSDSSRSTFSPFGVSDSNTSRRSSPARRFTYPLLYSLFTSSTALWCL